METVYIDYRREGRDRASLQKAARTLQSGGLVAFPTETVYGLGASTFREKALERIFEVKGRPQDNPLIVHLAEVSDMAKVAQKIPARAYLLAEKFWPGPLTLVLERSPSLPARVSCGLGTVAVRVPSHPVAGELLREAGVPVAAPSANRSGSPSPTRAGHVWQDLAGKIEAIVDGGECDIGVESTVLDLSGEAPVLLRPGGVTVEQLEDCLGESVVTGKSGAEKDAPVSPGLKYRHYAPRALLFLFSGEPEKVEAEMTRHFRFWKARNYRVGLLCTGENPLRNEEAVVECLGPREDPERAAFLFYSALRQMDQQGVDMILVEGYPETGVGLALMNRMKKAAREVIQCER